MAVSKREKSWSQRLTPGKTVIRGTMALTLVKDSRRPNSTRPVMRPLNLGLDASKSRSAGARLDP